MDIYMRCNPDYSYKSIELEPEILAIIENKSDQLWLKAPIDKGFAVLCSQDKTFRLRQKNHSNTVALLKHYFGLENIGNKKLMGISVFDSDFECNQIRGTIDTSSLPIFDGVKLVEDSDATIDGLKSDSPISDTEFDRSFADVGGTAIAGQAYLLSNKVISKFLNTLITGVLAYGLDFQKLDLIDVTNKLQETDMTKEMTQTILRKFSDQLFSPFSLSETKVALWYGITCLKKHAHKLISPQEFLIKWKLEFPELYNIPIDLNLLYGNFARPLPNRIQYFPKDLLSSNLKERLEQLFQIQNSWDLEEISPFIQELNTKNLKIDKLVLKYARRKVKGDKIIVSSR